MFPISASSRMCAVACAQIACDMQTCSVVLVQKTVMENDKREMLRNEMEVAEMQRLVKKQESYRKKLKEQRRRANLAIAEQRAALEAKIAEEQETNARILSACSERGLVLFLQHKRRCHLNRGTLPVPCMTRAERLAHAKKLQEAAVATLLCEGLDEEWSDGDQ